MLVNGMPGPPIQHGRGLRQDDPLSPMLFALAIDPLVSVLRKATENGRRQSSCRFLFFKKRQWRHIKLSIYFANRTDKKLTAT
jgi:hypothetical protein